MSDGKWFIGLVLVFGLLWINARTKTKTPETPPDAGMPAPAQTAPQTAPPPASAAPVPPAGTVISQSAVPEPKPNFSPLRGKLVIGSAQLYGSVGQEYVLIQAPYTNVDDIPITGLALRSGESLKSQTIGLGWSLFFPGNIGEGETVRLKPGGAAYVISGRSPFALTTGPLPNRGGFQLNTCTGFFAQGFGFYPSLPIQCPAPIYEPLPQAPNRLSDACYDYLATIPSCTMPSNTVPPDLLADGNCQAHLFNKIGYSQCVSYHKDEPGFFKNEWRLYLGRDSEFWRDKREVVELLDPEGRLIDRWAY